MINNILELSKEIYMVPWSVLLILTAVVTLFSLISGVGSDVDFDVDVDVDTDLDADISTDGLLESFYIFLNVGKVPVTLIIFTIVTVNWTIGMIVNLVFNPGNYSIVGWGIFIVTLIISFPITKVLTNPIKHLFSSMIEDKESMTQIVGGVCTAITEVSDSTGQASIKDGPTIVNLMVKAEKGKSISKGKKQLSLKKTLALIDT